VATALFTYAGFCSAGSAATGCPYRRPQALTLGLVHVLKTLLCGWWAVLWFPINWSWEPNELLAVLVVAYILSAAWLAFVRMERAELLFR